ncbi:class I SAM-dependent methyltransferase family protein [Methanococcus maripaludis]|uniref:tRNA (guanine(37)-N(1))-methyltransferase n=2 Tax=Methanococcus maripaludis TaxID=39152 RepID=A0A7J9PLG1_METMI|nr:class I SAM-dependent methyltransferase family protein [Methanococcus maripaludis]MBA2862339.1 tRNA (guanine37-N1)-methyltransferase [Methanococcus maripaludis]
MISCIKVNSKLGEKTRKIILDNDLLSKNYKLKKEGEFLYIPLTSSNFDKQIFEDENIDFEVLELDENNISKIDVEKKTSFKDYLLKNFKDEVDGNLIAHAYDIVGDIVILQIAEEIAPEIRKKIGENALKLIPSVKAVFRRESDVKGDFRVRDLEHLAGEEKTLTTYKENGYRLLVDVSKVYFSPRLGWERKRIMDLVTFDDIVVDMFCGVGPYSIACKNAEKIYSIDINPDGIELLKQNIVLNGLENKIVPILDDVRNVDVKGTRVIMNLPKYAHEFVNKALEIVEEGGIIHYYTVGSEFIEGIELFKSKCECEVVDKRIVKSYSPREYVFVIDFKILKKN